MSSTLSQRLRLVLITDRSAARFPLLEAVESALRGGVSAVMLREKTLSTRELYELAVPLRQITKKAGALLIINDRIDIALAVKADGVHLGWQSLPIPQARLILGPERIIGSSTHSPKESQAAQRAGADYITFSPIYPTPSKEGLVEVQGLEGLEAVRDQVRIPVIALGGICSDNAAEARSAGADGIAVIRAILDSEDPESSARGLTYS